MPILCVKFVKIYTDAVRGVCDRYEVWGTSEKTDLAPQDLVLNFKSHTSALSSSFGVCLQFLALLNYYMGTALCFVKWINFKLFFVLLMVF